MFEGYNWDKKKKLWFYIDRDSLIPKFEIQEDNFLEQQNNISKFLVSEVKGTKELAQRYIDFLMSKYIDQLRCGVSFENLKKNGLFALINNKFQGTWLFTEHKAGTTIRA